MVMVTAVAVVPSIGANGSPTDQSGEVSGARPARLVPAPPDSQHTHQLEGIASWYGGKFQGRLTANGEIFDTNELTAAHRTIPFDTIVRVTNRDTNRSVEVRINDRGPFVDNRVIDLSRAAASRIGLTASGIAPVDVEIVHYVPEPDSRIIQIASFSRRENAEAVVGQLVREDLPAAVESATNHEVFRVVLTDVKAWDVDEYRERLASLGFRSVLVRRD
ncbi:MAG TPA: septal ring lytic transglycosylase RlpA family protein [Alkalispirochaeta sp.]|nr:septal ring lytic transglycosylase RlpA family protein [Alkalispirochaeta sp.]